MKKSWFLALAVCNGLLAVTPLAQGSIIGPGQSVTSPTLTQEGVLGAANFASIGFTPFSFGGVNGNYREFVSSGRTGNPLGGLSFEYQFNVSSGSVQSFSTTGFAGWQTNVTFAPGGTVAPIQADRSGGFGDLITFTLGGGGVGPGVTSMWLIVDTNAPTASANTISLFGGGGSVSAPALGPPATVPEPSTLGILAGLLVAMCCFRRWIGAGQPA